MRPRILVALVCLLGAAAARAAETKADAPASPILTRDESVPRPAAKLAEIGWLAGHWRGTGFGGEVEETWFAPKGTSMVGMFRLTNNGQAQIYEIFAIVEEEGSLALRLKHFTGALKAWEDKEKFVNFPLVKLEARAAYFAGLTYKLEGDDTLRVWVAVGAKPGEPAKPVELVYRRVKG